MRGGAPPGGRPLMYVSALAGLVAMVGMWNFFEQRRPPRPEWRHVLVVPAFEAAELRAGLLRELSRFPDLEVIDLARGQETPEHADLVLESALEPRDAGWWLTARLRDLDEDRVLWSDAFAVDQASIEEAGSRVARQISLALKIHPAEPS